MARDRPSASCDRRRPLDPLAERERGLDPPRPVALDRGVAPGRRDGSRAWCRPRPRRRPVDCPHRPRRDLRPRGNAPPRGRRVPRGRQRRGRDSRRRRHEPGAARPRDEPSRHVGQVAFAEIQVLGEADAGPAATPGPRRLPGRSPRRRRGPRGRQRGGRDRAARQGTRLDGAIQYTNRFAFVAVPPGADHLVALHPLGDHSVTVPGVVLPGPLGRRRRRSASG